jgi:hypothetical protein
MPAKPPAHATQPFRGVRLGASCRALMRVRQTSYASQPEAAFSATRGAKSSFAAFAGRGKVVNASTRVFMIRSLAVFVVVLAGVHIRAEREF